MRTHAEYTIPRVDHARRIVWIIDQDAGMSVTNAAEGVCVDLNFRYPGYRIMYEDTEGGWNELCHDMGKFVCFGPGLSVTQ